MAPVEPEKGGFLRSMRRVFREAAQSVQRPGLDVTVVAPPACIPAGSAVPLEPQIQDALGGIAEALGVPAQFPVTLAPSADATEARVLIAGQAVRLEPAELSAALAARGLTRAALRSAGNRADAFAVAVATACQVAVEWDPSVLVGPSQQQTMLARARTSGIRLYPDDVVAAALKRVVSCGISIKNLEPLNQVLGQRVELIETADELSEVAIDALRPLSIRLSLPEATLRAATLGVADCDAFPDMRRRLFSDLGVTFPDIEVVIDDDVPAGTAAVMLNHVPFAPRPLPPEPGAADLAAAVEQQLRLHAAWFVPLGEVRRTIEDVRLALPDLVGTIQEHYTDPQLSLFARAFVEERVPVRNAARLLTLLLDARAVNGARDDRPDLVRLAEPARGAGPGDARPSPRQVVSFTRQEINEEGTRSKPGTVTVTPARLPADLDAALAGAADPAAAAGPVGATDPAVLGRLTGLAEQQLGRPDPTLVTASQRSRAAARNLLARQYPDVAIVAAEEYPPGYRLAPPD